MARVLIVVHCDLELGEWLRELIASMGHQTLVATNAAQGWKLLDSVAPDLIITDVVLPGMDGLEAFQRLYGRPGPKVIMITGNREQWRVLGSDEWQGAERALVEPLKNP